MNNLQNKLYYLIIYFIVNIIIIIYNPISIDGQTNNDELFIDNEQTFENKKDVKVEDDPIEEDNNIFKLPDDVEEATSTIKVPPYSDNGISSNANENTFGLDNQNHEMNIKIKENEEINITLEVNKAKQKKYGIDNFQIKDPKNGQLSKVDTEQGKVIYKPGLGFYGDDSFEYNVIYRS